MARTRAARLAAVVIVLALGGGLAACTNDGLAQQYAEGSGKNYIAGSGVTEVKASDRGKPIDFEGTTETGEKVSAAGLRGNVVVVNFWYAACPPCRAEAKDLEKFNKKYQSDGVAFIGVNTRDSAGTAGAFDREFGVTYPSIMDADGGAVQLAFSGDMRPNATPTTFVLDAKGRIAARIDGGISDQPSTLDTLISDAVAEAGE
jgi:peroxiredoxin